jgi:hypothetical protein
MTQALYRQRKYNLALMFTFALIIAVFVGVISGAEFITGAGIVMAAYGASNVGQTWAEHRNLP